MANKLAISFSDFSNVSKTVGKPVKQNDKIFFVKSTLGAKVEVNLNSGTYTVGAGLKPEITDAIVKAAKDAGFKLVKRPKGWAVLEYADLKRFVQLVGIADSVLTNKPARTRKAKTAKSFSDKITKAVKASKKDSGKSDAEIAEIKAKRRKVMAEVGKKTGQPTISEIKAARKEYAKGKFHDGARDHGDFDPQLAKEEVEAILRDERLLDNVPKFLQD